MPKYIISYSYEKEVYADDIWEARQFLIDDVIADMEDGNNMFLLDIEEVKDERTNN